MDKPIVTVIGYIFLMLGFISIILSIVGLRLSFLSFLEFAGPLIAFMIKISLIMIGFIIMYISKTIQEDRIENE